MSDKFFFDLAVYDRVTHTPLLRVRKFRMDKLDETVQIIKDKYG